MSGLHADCNRIVRWLRTKSNANGQSNSNNDRNTDAYFDGETYAYATDSADTEAASDSGAKTVMPH